MSKLPTPPKESIVYEDKYLYVCLALFPVTVGHTIVVWKNEVPDLRDLTCKQYEHLMHVVDVTRDALLKMLKVKKVYLVYMDEAKHVHWQLVPRYDEKGFNIFEHTPKKTTDFSGAPKLRAYIAKAIVSHKSDFK
ncbi:MAG: HIT family protein [Candidatus Paceibacterota bacterium]|jgi:diadenosine tetraphosphate (Ap4A) HIT family hydrolase